MKNWIYINGEWKREKDAKISVLDRAYLYGEGLFETMKALAGKILFLREHYDRLKTGAKILGLEIPTRTEFEKVLKEILRRNDLQYAYLRLEVSRPNLSTSKKEPAKKMHWVVFASDLPGTPERFYTQGCSAVIIKDLCIPVDSISSIKATSFVRQALALRKAQALGADDAILLNQWGRVVETASASLFLYDGATWRTPPLAEGLLDGITRQQVLKLMKKSKIRVLETPLSIDELQNAEQVFLTTSIKDIVPLTRLNKKSIGTGKVGWETQQIMELYQDWIVAWTA